MIFCIFVLETMIILATGKIIKKSSNKYFVKKNPFRIEIEFVLTLYRFSETQCFWTMLAISFHLILHCECTWKMHKNWCSVLPSSISLDYLWGSSGNILKTFDSFYSASSFHSLPWIMLSTSMIAITKRPLYTFLMLLSFNIVGLTVVGWCALLHRISHYIII